MAETNTEPRIVYNAPTIRSWRDEGHFVIPGVTYRGQEGSYLLFEQMTPAMTQDALSELYETEKQAGNPHPADMPLIWAITVRDYELRNAKNPQNYGRLSQFLRGGFRSYPNTLTRIHYSPGNDVIVHNIGTSDQYSLEGNVVGDNGWVNNIQDKKVLEHLLGTNNVGQINDVSQWINRTDSYLWRLNSKPNQLDKRVAGFGAIDDWLVLICLRGSLDVSPAFRVMRVD